MTHGRRIAVLGEALVDVVQQGDGATRACPGGSGLNTSIALARLGASVSFCGALANDDDGAALSRFMEAETVDLSFAVRSARPCPRVIATPGRDGSPSYVFHLEGSALDEAPGGWRTPADLQHLHATSFASTCGAQGAAALGAMQGVRGSASTSFDPNVRRAMLPALPQARALIAARIAQSDIVKVSTEDLAELGDVSGALLRDWRALGPKLIVLTRGAAGALALFGDEEAEAPAPVVCVRDTIGAGDTFMAALLAQMAGAGALGPVMAGLDGAQVASWLALAAKAAALCCAREGCDPPHRANIEALQ